MSENYVKIYNLSVSDKIYNFINNEALPDLHIKKDHFWKNFDKAAHELASKNKELLNVRRKLQLEIDRYHLINKNKLFKKSVIRLGRSLSKLGNYNNELEKFIKNFN